VRAQLSAQKGGADVIFDEKGGRIGGARLLAVVTIRPGEQGRHYRLPNEKDYKAVYKAQKTLKEIIDEWEKGGRKGLCPVPDEPLPPIGTLGFRVQRYGMLQWGDLFTARQKIAKTNFLKYIVLKILSNDKFKPMCFFLTRLTDKNASLVSYDSGRETIGHVFNRQALPIVWDFVESAFHFNEENIADNSLDILSGVIATCSKSTNQNIAQIQKSDACESNLPSESANLWFTDPPYYDAVPYADLSDFFFVWLKRALPKNPFLKDPLNSNNILTPKKLEIVQDETKEFNGCKKDRNFFEERMGKAFSEGCRVIKNDGIGSVVFAHKTTEGWEALLSGMIKGGWTITGSWPIATERPGRLRSLDSAALATSVHLICRPRPSDALIGDWAEVYQGLLRRVPEWMDRLQKEGIRGADLVFACIGPAIEIFSKYSKVVDPQDREIPLGGNPEESEPHKRGFLAYVWEVVGRTALEQVLGTGESKVSNGSAGVLEEDARLTALFLWTLQSTNGSKEESEDQKIEDEESDETEDDEEETPKVKPKGFSLIFDIVRRFAQPLGIHLPDWEQRIIETKKGVVRLLSITERAKQLFGEETASAIADRIESMPEISQQLTLFPLKMDERAPQIKVRKTKRHTAVISDESFETKMTATTLDRVHAAMLLQKSGRTNALRALLKSEQERSPAFMRLANALSALYPEGSEERRLIEALLKVQV
jgi:hypothetical protein